MDEPKDDFFEHIKQVLRNHEEDYREGAWEQFSGMQSPAPVRKTPPVSIWKWAAAAAAVTGILFLAPYLFTKHPNTPPPPAEIVKTTEPKNNTAPLPDSNSKTSADQEQQQLTKDVQKKTQKGQPAAVRNYLYPVIKEMPVSLAKASSPEIVAPGQLTPVPKQNDIATGQPAKERPAPGFWQNHIIPGKEPLPNTPQQEINNRTQILAQNTAPEKETKERSRTRKWVPSLYVSPMFAESGVNMGYGVALAYAVNDRIKVSTGLAHNKISTSRDYAPETAAAALNTPATFSLTAKRMAFAAPVQSPKLKSVQGVLSGFDIPVDISYAFSKKLYATAGVSGLVVVNDNTNYTLITSTNTQISVVNSQGVLQEDKRIVNNSYTSATSLPGELNHDKTSFLGFYNLSIGYKQKITPKNNVSIEPFLKVPVKTVTNQNLNYKGMGIRLKFDF